MRIRAGLATREPGVTSGARRGTRRLGPASQTVGSGRQRSRCSEHCDPTSNTRVRLRMTTRPRSALRVLMALSIAVTAVACAPNDTMPSGLGSNQLSVSADTVTGTGDVSELQQRRSAWLARGIDDYRVQLQITCFCGGDIRRPVLVEVRDGAVAKVWDLETARAVTDLSLYPSITKLFDKAIAERSGGGHVSVAYDRELGIPARIEIGTLANDAGTLYTLADLRPL